MRRAIRVLLAVIFFAFGGFGFLSGSPDFSTWYGLAISPEESSSRLT